MSFFSKFGSCWGSAAVAPRVYLGDAVAEEQSVTRLRSSKWESAANWQPALAAIVEDSKGAQSPWKKSSKKKPEKKTSGCRGRFMTKSYGYYDGRDNYWTNSMAIVFTGAIHVLKVNFDDRKIYITQLGFFGGEIKYDQSRRGVSLTPTIVRFQIRAKSRIVF